MCKGEQMNKKLLFLVTLAVIIICSLMFVPTAKADTSGTLHPKTYPVYFTMDVKLNGVSIGNTSATVSSNTDGVVSATIGVGSPITLYGGDVVTASFIDCAGDTMRTDTIANGPGTLNVATWTAYFNVYTFLFTPDAGATFSIDYILRSSGTNVTGVSFTANYYITVTSSYDTPTSSQFVASGGSLACSVTSPVSLGSGIQASCTGYSIDGGGNIAGTSYTFTSVSANHSLTFNWEIQYYVTFGQTGLDATAQGTVVTVNSVAKTYSDLPFSYWASSGSSATFSYASTLNSSTTNKQFVLSSYYSSPVTITGPVSISDGYTVQYYLNVVSPYSSPLGSGWYNAGSTAYASVSSTSVSGGGGIQYGFSSWTGSGTGSYTGSTVTPAITMNAPILETAVWVTQYYVTVYGVYGASTGSGWYNAGATANFDVESPISGGTGIQTAFASWTGSGSGSYTGSTKSASCTVNGAITETANWDTQYYLTVSSTYGSTTGQGWYTSGTTAYAGLTTGSINGSTGTRYSFTSWSTGGANYSQSSPIMMNYPVTTYATWSTEYYLTVISAYDTPSGSGWFNSGATAYAYLSTNLVTIGNTTYTFAGWSGDATGSSITSNGVTMTSPKTGTAVWTSSGGTVGNVTYTVDLHGPFHEDGVPAAGETIACSLTYANQTVYHFTMNSSAGSYQNITITSTSELVQLTWNASSALNYTRVYHFISGVTSDDVRLFIPDPTLASYIYSFTVTDFYGMIRPYLESRVSPDGTNSYVVERVDLGGGSGTVSFIMTQYQIYTLSFVCSQGIYSQSFSAQIQGMPGQYPVGLNVLSGNFPSTVNVFSAQAEASRVSGSTVHVTYIDPSSLTDWVYIRISHKSGSTTIIDYAINSTGSVQSIYWVLGNSTLSYSVHVEALINSTSYTWNLVAGIQKTSHNPWDNLWDFLGHFVPSLPSVFTGWPSGMTSTYIAEIVGAIIVALFLCIGSFRSAGTCAILSWIIFGILIYLGWFGVVTPYTIPQFAVSGFVAIIVAIDEGKQTVRET
jgi:hypothetical protein